jgi:hypothetical protein
MGATTMIAAAVHRLREQEKRVQTALVKTKRSGDVKSKLKKHRRP